MTNDKERKAKLESLAQDISHEDWAKAADRLEQLSAHEGAEVLANLETDQAADAVEHMEPAHSADVLEDMVPQKAADVVEQMDFEHSAAVLEQMEPQAAADLVKQVMDQYSANVLEDMDGIQAAAIVERLAPDDAADVLAGMGETQRRGVLTHLDPQAAGGLGQLLRYDPDSAGGTMNTQFVSLGAADTVEQAIERIRKQADEIKQIYYTYVVDEQSRLLGVVSMRDLILAKPNTPLREVMNCEPISASVSDDREQVIEQTKEYDLLAIPVVDDGSRLVGVVTIDDVVDAMDEEFSEDVQKMVGVSGMESVSTPWVSSLRSRMPWLLVNLMTATLAATVVAFFRDQIANLVALAVLMPIVANQGGNTGQQALAVTIRALALGQIGPHRAWAVVRRELLLGITHGLIIGGLCALIAGWLWSSPWLGLVIGLAMLCNLIVASAVGAAIPLTMRRLGVDPAQSSTIFLTMITDTVGFASFLGLAKLFWHLLG